MHLFSSYQICPVGRPETNHKKQNSIKTVMRCPNNMVMVFDGQGEQIPEYQGQYLDVRNNILSNASPETVFSHLSDYYPTLHAVPRAQW